MRNLQDLLQPLRSDLLSRIAELEDVRDNPPEDVRPGTVRDALRRARQTHAELVGRDPTPSEVDAHRS